MESSVDINFKINEIIGQINSHEDILQKLILHVNQIGECVNTLSSNLSILNQEITTILSQIRPPGKSSANQPKIGASSTTNLSPSAVRSSF